MSDTLLAALRRGETEAWNEAFRVLYPCAWSAARHPSAGLTPTEAEDVAIEALHEIVPLVPSVSSWDGLKALTVTIAARRAISLRRRLSAQKRGGSQVVSLDAQQEEGHEASDEPDGHPSNLPPQELWELRALLQTSLDALEPGIRSVIEDILLEGLSYKEVAEKRGLPMGTVGVNLARGLKKIRVQLEHTPRLLKELRDFLR